MSKQLKKKVKLTASSGQGSSEGHQDSFWAPLRPPGPGASSRAPLRDPGPSFWAPLTAPQSDRPHRPARRSSSGGDRRPQKPRKKCTSFQMQWLLQYVQTLDDQVLKLGDVFSFSEEKGVICKTCREAGVPGDLSQGKMWNEWKVDYLKKHVVGKSHVNAVGILQRMNGVVAVQQESAEEKIQSDEQPHPENWPRENDAVKFVHSISEVAEHETMCNIRKAPWHTLIVSLRTDLLMMYIKYREEKEVSYRTDFCGIVELKTRRGQDIAEAITQFYSSHGLDLQRMVMLTSDDSSVVLGENDAAVTLLRRQIPHLTEHLCMIHGKDARLNAAWGDVPLMRHVDDLLDTLARVARRSAASPGVPGKPAPRSLSDLEPRWLARYRAMLAVRKDGLAGYGVPRQPRDSLAKHCVKKLGELQAVLPALIKVLGEVVELDDRLRKCDLTAMDGHRLARATVEKRRDQYWQDETEMERDPWLDCTTADQDVDLFTRLVAETLEAHFSGDSLKEWSAFDIAALRSSVGSQDGSTGVATLAQKYEAILRPQSTDAIKREYNKFKCMLREQLELGTISTFSDVVAATLVREELREVSQLVDICGTFQASTAECDRGFKLMNEIKKTSGASVEVEYLERLIRIKSRNGAHRDTNLDEVYKRWRSEKDGQGT